MSYTPRPDVPRKFLKGIEAQAVVELDSGDLAAINYNASRTVLNTLACHARAWLVDAEGDPQASDNVPVMTEYRHNASAILLAQLGTETLAQELTRLVLGEPATDPAIIPWPEDIRATVSLRNAIAIARASGPISDLAAVI